MIYLLVGGGDADIECINETLDEFKSCDFFVLAVDAGYETCRQAGLEPKLLLGDFDSLGKEMASTVQASGIELVTLNPIKDDTDMEAAIRLVAGRMDRETDRIIMVSSLGGRLDHSLGCISLLGLSKVYGACIELRDSQNHVRMLFGGDEYDFDACGQFGKFVSFLPVGGKAVLTLEGMKYPLENGVLEGFNTLGISNEVVAKKAKAIIVSGTVIMIESKDKDKKGDRLC